MIAQDIGRTGDFPKDWRMGDTAD